MYQRLSAILFPLAIVLLVGAAFWGYQEHQEKNSILIKAENQYQHAFHDLSYHLDELHSELGKMLAVKDDSSDFQRRGLIQVWRITSEAQSEIDQLPLTLLPFHKTEKFLAQLSNFAYRTALRDLRKEPITASEQEILRTLYERSKEIAAEVRSVQEKVIAHNLRWMDVEIAIASENEPGDNMIIDGFKLVDKKVNEYPEVNWGPGSPDIFRVQSVNLLKGKAVKPSEIKRKAARFFGVRDTRNLRIVENGRGTEYASYTVTAQDSGGSWKADFSKRGGHLLWFSRFRDVAGKKLGVAEAREKAEAFLKEHGYDNMTAVSYDEHQNVAHFLMARKIGDVTVYPDQLTVQVALDNGEIIGLHAARFAYALDKKRNIGKPGLSPEEAKSRLNGNFETRSQALALIENDDQNEVLCYEFVGRVNGSDYRVFINALTGAEEKIEQLKTAETEAVG